MPSTICANCGRLTNSAVSNYWMPDDPDGVPKEPGVATKCYAVLVNKVWVKGCGYDSLGLRRREVIDDLLGRKWDIHEPG